MDKSCKVALIGNPNVGKSTLFNCLTGMKQHTGNWSGKTVDVACGEYEYNRKTVEVVDLPGTYSLRPASAEEEVAGDYVAYGDGDIIVVVCNPTCLERNFNLLLQVSEITKNVVLCVNMMDEAKEKGIEIDKEKLEECFEIPVVFMSARENKGVDDLQKAIDTYAVKDGGVFIEYDEVVENAVEKCLEVIKDEDVGVNKRWLALRIVEGQRGVLKKARVSEETAEKLLGLITANNYGDEISESIINCLARKAKEYGEKAITQRGESYSKRDRALDRVLTGRYTSLPAMALLLLGCFWITVFGANYVSEYLFGFFGYVSGKIYDLLMFCRVNRFVVDIIVDGVLKTLFWVVSVMLPPMSIFFPLFALLEDSGYLPRIAFNLDKTFCKCGTCGKQSLTCALGLGCNAVGVMGCRIINSPRERLIAVLTNNFMPCNGRFPTMIAIISMFFVGGIKAGFSGVAVGMILFLMIVLGLGATFVSSYILSKTVLSGMPSSFVMELPAYRKPKIIKVVVRAFADKTLKVLIRAVVVSAPMGAVIWLMANIRVGDVSLLGYITAYLDGFGRAFGMDGVIITGFILGLPANEIVVPIILMMYLSKGSMINYDNLGVLKEILINNGWTVKTALCTLVFSLMHWPCSTTLMTIKKETGEYKWVLLSVLIPTLWGFLICFIINIALR